MYLHIKTELSKSICFFAHQVIHGKNGRAHFWKFSPPWSLQVFQKIAIIEAILIEEVLFVVC